MTMNELKKEPQTRSSKKSPPACDRMEDVKLLMDVYKAKEKNREEEKKRKMEDLKVAEQQKGKERKEEMNLMVQSVTTIVTPLAEVFLQNQAMARAEAAQAREAAAIQNHAMILALTTFSEALKKQHG